MIRNMVTYENALSSLLSYLWGVGVFAIIRKGHDVELFFAPILQPSVLLNVRGWFAFTVLFFAPFSCIYLMNSMLLSRVNTKYNKVIQLFLLGTSLGMLYDLFIPVFS